MKSIPHMSTTEFSRRFEALALGRLTQTKAKFRESFGALLEHIGDACQFQALWQFCRDVGADTRLRLRILNVWDQVMATKLLLEVELRKPVYAGLFWIKENADKYIAIYRQCAPGARIAQHIKQLFAAAGCEMPA